MRLSGTLIFFQKLEHGRPSVRSFVRPPDRPSVPPCAALIPARRNMSAATRARPTVMHGHPHSHYKIQACILWLVARSSATTSIAMSEAARIASPMASSADSESPLEALVPTNDSAPLISGFSPSVIASLQAEFDGALSTSDVTKAADVDLETEGRLLFDAALEMFPQQANSTRVVSPAQEAKNIQLMQEIEKLKEAAKEGVRVPCHSADC